MVSSSRLLMHLPWCAGLEALLTLCYEITYVVDGIQED